MDKLMNVSERELKALLIPSFQPTFTAELMTKSFGGDHHFTYNFYLRNRWMSECFKLYNSKDRFIDKFYCFISTINSY